MPSCREDLPRAAPHSEQVSQRPLHRHLTRLPERDREMDHRARGSLGRRDRDRRGEGGLRAVGAGDLKRVAPAEPRGGRGGEEAGHRGGDMGPGGGS